MIDVKIIADSLHPHPAGSRLTTFLLTYPRFIHAEFMTHRMFSRNASSSRAIPVKKQIQMVRDNPAVPIAFLANKPGMQGGRSFGAFKQWLCRVVWMSACYTAVFFAIIMDRLNLHKQYANRILEPWAHISVVCSATDWDNFFALRIHPAAMPEIQELASKMHTLYRDVEASVETTPNGWWHLPFMPSVTYPQPREVERILIQRSVAKCARVSYLNHEGKDTSVEEDLALYERLVGSHPIHASPTEHQATPGDPYHYYGNFRGWKQWRKFLPNENVTEYKP